jgi:hypothetical protein
LRRKKENKRTALHRKEVKGNSNYEKGTVHACKANETISGGRKKYKTVIHRKKVK